MKLTDVLPIEKWLAFEKDVTERSGLCSNVFDTEGIRITDFHAWPNRLCPAVKATSKGQAFICAVAHMNLANEAMKTRKPVIEECDAGLLKIVTPIFVNNTFMGAMGACGLLLDDGEVDTFLVNKITEIDEENVEELSDGIEAITMEKAIELSEYMVAQIHQLIAGHPQDS